MSKDTILHLFTAARNLSPFDVNMAIDAGWRHCIPYTDLTPEDMAAYTQDAIFSRGPKGVKATGIFVGGRDVHTAMDMLRAAESSMVPPFEVSVFADPSGAFTTAAGMVACVEKHFAAVTGESLEGKRALIFGGTGPVGTCCAMLAAQAGAQSVIVSHESVERAASAAQRCRDSYGIEVSGAAGSNDAEIADLIAGADVAFCAAKAGIQVLSETHLARAEQLRVLCDVNAVPPSGIAGVGVMAAGEPVEGTPRGAAGIGALSVGNVKYQTQQRLLQTMLSAEKPVYLDFRHALDMAREVA